MLKSFRSYQRRPSNGFVLALCIALTITLIAVSLSAKSPFTRSTNLETEQIDEGSEYWAIFGHRLKITDTLLVVLIKILSAGGCAQFERRFKRQLAQAHLLIGRHR